MRALVVAASDVAAMKVNLLGKGGERCAVLFTSEAKADDAGTRLLVREVEFPLPSDYAKNGPLEAELRPDFVARMTKRARLNENGLVFAHSHPGTEAPLFSEVDRAGEERLDAFLSHRYPTAQHVALVISEGGMRARLLGSAQDIQVVSLGATREVLADPSSILEKPDELFDRQVRLFGAEAQRVLQTLRVGIVGLGGTGSIVAQQLVHLGVRTFTLIDADVLEKTNLNRVANAGLADIGNPKVDIAARYIRAFASDAVVERVVGDVVQRSVADKLTETDLLFGCTDSHGSRAVLQQVAYQYLIPCIDMGVAIAMKAGRVSHVYGRVQLLAPDFACLTCNGLLDVNQVRQDMMTAFERKADPYILGAQEPAPAVMSLNTTVASLAVTMMLAIVARFPLASRHVLYNATASALRSVRREPDSNCYICSRRGAFARGDSWPLFARDA